MQISETALTGVMIIDTRVHGDARGFFRETYNEPVYDALGICGPFCQDNAVWSVARTLRGLHYQHPYGQAKLVSVIQGEVFDVAVDIRQNSPTFGKWVGANLSGENGRQLFVPVGYAHGYCVVSAGALIIYKCAAPYHPESEGSIVWNDPAIGIDWPMNDPILSDKDKAALPLCDIATEHLPRFDHL